MLTLRALMCCCVQGMGSQPHTISKAAQAAVQTEPRVQLHLQQQGPLRPQRPGLGQRQQNQLRQQYQPQKLDSVEGLKQGDAAALGRQGGQQAQAPKPAGQPHASVTEQKHLSAKSSVRPTLQQRQQQPPKHGESVGPLILLTVPQPQQQQQQQRVLSTPPGAQQDTKQQKQALLLPVQQQQQQHNDSTTGLQPTQPNAEPAAQQPQHTQQPAPVAEQPPQQQQHGLFTADDMHDQQQQQQQQLPAEEAPQQQQQPGTAGAWELPGAPQQAEQDPQQPPAALQAPDGMQQLEQSQQQLPAADNSLAQQQPQQQEPQQQQGQPELVQPQPGMESPSNTPQQQVLEEESKLQLPLGQEVPPQPVPTATDSTASVGSGPDAAQSTSSTSAQQSKPFDLASMTRAAVVTQLTQAKQEYREAAQELTSEWYQTITPSHKHSMRHLRKRLMHRFRFVPGCAMHSA